MRASARGTRAKTLMMPEFVILLRVARLIEVSTTVRIRRCGATTR
jgi:hypothetical protein